MNALEILNRWESARRARIAHPVRRTRDAEYKWGVKAHDATVSAAHGTDPLYIGGINILGEWNRIADMK